ncbi:MAG: hypothetical protein M1826_002449 [Phylliscum demangeonii]|nr:MAG: hypothetical protein M1826_002449 [Phylliscum demangeonii]
MKAKTKFIAVGGNSHPSAADWDAKTGYVAFGADRNVALWNPLDSTHRGIQALLPGHTDRVNVVRFFYSATSAEQQALILSGSADRTIRIWKLDLACLEQSRTLAIVVDEENAANAIAVNSASGIFVSGAAEARVKVRRIEWLPDGSLAVSLLQVISLMPRFFPLALALSPVSSVLSPPASAASLVLAVGGTGNVIQIYVGQAAEGSSLEFHLCAGLAGHEGWIRSLAFVFEESESAGCDLLLASASQDRYIRLWRVHEGTELPVAVSAGASAALGSFGKSLSNKAQRFPADGSEYSITFEALLLGHEDWIYTVSWARKKQDGSLQLLSASADGSLAVWEAEATSGVWVPHARLGEIRGQKGATTATGSTGAYWIGLWSPSGQTVMALGRAGAWRRWTHDPEQDHWVQAPAVSGHIKAVTGIAWARHGGYLVSTSSDQTTRLFAEWKHDEAKPSWHEFSRPQIHGYDLNCIDVLDDCRFVSAADEKLLRVFDQPTTVATLLEECCGIRAPGGKAKAQAASVPALGLSNKAVQQPDEDEVEQLANGMPDDTDGGHEPPVDLVRLTVSVPPAHPPIEDTLARHTLWPESEKLYGHGYEISAVSVSHDGTIVATACRASSIDHAVIRLYDSHGWREIKPALRAHSLTVTRLRFSADDRYLLSVGRDRQWAVFERDDGDRRLYRLKRAEPRSHSRMILDASWAPIVGLGRMFMTASRDKLATLWLISQRTASAAGPFDVAAKASFACDSAVTAIDILPRLAPGDQLLVALGCEDGTLHMLAIDTATEEGLSRATRLQIAWRPPPSIEDAGLRPLQLPGPQMAVASEDCSVRVYGIDVDSR